MPATIEQNIGFTACGDGVRIAYATSGLGAPLVKTANWLTHIDFDCRSSIWLHWIEFLSSCASLLRYDERGNGLSDRDVEDLSFDRWVDDLECVVEKSALKRFSLIGISQGGAVALEYAARYPEKVDKIILWGAYAQGWEKRDDEQERRRARALLDLISSGWGDPNPAYETIFANLFAPDANEEQVRSFTELQRLAADPRTAARLVEAAGRIDIRDSLPRVTAPTLVMHGTQDARVPFDQGRRLAAAIENARFVPLDTRNHALLAQDPAWPIFKSEFHKFFGTGPARSESPVAVCGIFGELTPREISVTQQVAAGLDNSEIGLQLGISEKTVRNHLTRIFDKLGVESRAQLIVKVHQGTKNR